MIRLLYTSKAAQGIADEQVRDILKSAQRNNLALSVTGVLVYGGGLFMQVLEGAEQSVIRQYAKILDDRRHSDCEILLVSPATNRLFEKWSMGMIRSNPMDFQHIAELRAHRQAAVEGKAFADAMREFVARLKAGSAH